MESYKRWVRMNREYVHSFESLANGVTWLLPERFSESEIGPEAVTAVLGIITAINEHIIDTTPTQIPAGSVEPRSFPYPLCISMIKELETLVEVASQHYFGDDKKWNFIALTEATKVVVRLALFRNSGYRMLLQGGETPNVENPSDPSRTSKPGNHNEPHDFPNMNGRSQGTGRGKALSALNRFRENAQTLAEPDWLRRVQHQQSIIDPPAPVVQVPSLSKILSERGASGALFILGEALFITRPLIYVLLIRRYGLRSWIPWFLSLAVDIIGVGFVTPLSKLQFREREQQTLNDSEKHELRRRKLLWALYLMRDPFFSKYTRQRLEMTEKTLEPVPVVGVLTGKLVELLCGAQTRYTYMSGS
ncbi:Peroxisome biogenesis protein 16 [Linum perenne]